MRLEINFDEKTAKTLLEKFINEKLKEIPDNFSEVKYTAAVLSALLNKKQDELAQILGITHGLLRKWRSTEEEFSKLDELLPVEFASIVVKYMIGEFKKRHDENAKKFSKSKLTHRKLKKFAKKYSSVPSPPGILDFNIYSKKVVSEIFNIIQMGIYNYSEIDPNWDNLHLFFNVAEFLSNNQSSQRKSIDRFIKKFHSNLIEAAFNVGRDILLKKNVSKKEIDALRKIFAILEGEYLRNKIK